HDGCLDLFAALPDARRRLSYRNNGVRTLTKLTTTQVGQLVSEGSSTRSASWGDYDNDGFLDLIVGNDGPSTIDLYHIEGNGTFTRLGGNTVGSLVNEVLGQSVGAVWWD